MKYLIISIILFSQVTNAQKKEKILFVGNSFTFYWNLPSQVEKMALEQNLPWDVYQSTSGGASLRDHWQGNKELKTKELLSEITFDRVIFQDHSTYPIKHIDTTEYYFSKLRSLISQHTKIYLYATWAYPKFPVEEVVVNNSKGIESNLRAVSRKYSNVEIIPVGRAFDLFSSKYPEIKL